MSKAIMAGLLTFTTLAGASALAQANKHAPPAANGANSAPAPTTPVVVTITPVALAEASGCWARVYDGHDYRGRMMMLSGEQSLPRLEFGTGFDWEGIDSIEVGPKARLTLYNDEGYRDKKREVKAGEKVSDFDQGIFSEVVESLRLACTQK